MTHHCPRCDVTGSLTNIYLLNKVFLYCIFIYYVHDSFHKDEKQIYINYTIILPEAHFRIYQIPNTNALAQKIIFMPITKI